MTERQKKELFKVYPICPNCGKPIYNNQAKYTMAKLNRLIHVKCIDEFAEKIASASSTDTYKTSIEDIKKEYFPDYINDSSED